MSSEPTPSTKYDKDLAPAVAYCCTAWDGPGAGLAELRAACDAYAADQQLTVVAWLCEVVRDDTTSRLTPLLLGMLERLAAGQVLLIAESATLYRSGTVVPILRQLAPALLSHVVAVTGFPGTVPTGLLATSGSRVR